MICEKCKIREATIQYTEVVNGRRTVHSYCAQCARETDFGAVSALFDGEFPFAKILSALFGGGEEQSENGNYAQVVCPTCGSSYQDFVENSRFGCADCYELFDLLIRDSIKSLQGNETHKGKQPKYGLKMVPESLTKGLPGAAAETPGPAELEENGAGDAGAAAGTNGAAERIGALKEQLAEAIREEEYEEAARLRDEIRALEREAERQAEEGNRDPEEGGASDAEMV